MAEQEQVQGTVEARLRLGPGLLESDRAEVVAALSSLNRHLAHWRPDQIDLRLSVRDRNFSDQKVTLEIWLPGRHSLLASAGAADLNKALVEARKIAIREIEAEFGRL